VARQTCGSGFSLCRYTAVMTEQPLGAEIARSAREWGFSVEERRVKKVGAFLELLLQWNAKVNLTGANSAGELVGEHLVDSFALSTLVPKGASVVDVGSGGGLPAIPFAVLRPDCRVTLVEPRAKRTAFLATAQRLVGDAAGLALVRGRHEDVAPGSFDVAMSRATFPPGDWLAVAASLVRPGGSVVVLASGRVEALGEYDLLEERRYRTGSGSTRWAARFVPRGTSVTAP
jgi:16S rRNA (guanine527-N7)-methyltransferase